MRGLGGGGGHPRSFLLGDMIQTCSYSLSSTSFLRFLYNFGAHMLTRQS